MEIKTEQEKDKMNSDLIVLVTWVRREDMQLLKSAVRLNRDTSLGQNYMFWKEADVASKWAKIFDHDEQVEILAVEEIFDIR